MAVTVDIPEIESNLESTSVTIDVQSLDPSNMDGGTGSITFSTRASIKPNLFRNKRFLFTNSHAGSIVGRISTAGWGDAESTQFDAETMLNRLNVDVTLFPQQSDLNTGMDTVLAKVGMVSSGLATTSTTFPGWKGSLLDYLKHFCVVFNYEMVPHDTDPDTVVFRAVRASTFQPNLLTISYRTQDQNLAQNVEFYNYNYSTMSGSNVELTPNLVEDLQILTVNAGETLEYEVQLEGWAATVNQPTALDLVGPEVRTDGGAYCVAGSDGLPITAAQWTAQGGSVTVSITDDPSTLKVVVQAPTVGVLKGVDGTDKYAPYSIAASALDDTLYNSLHITGTGVPWRKELLKLPTGVDSEITVQDVGVTVDNPWASTSAKAYTLGVRAAQSYCGPQYTFDASSGDDVSGITSISGSRFQSNEAIFRTLSSTITEGGETFTGIMDTIIGDVNTVWTGQTVADFNTAFATTTFDEWTTIPLNTTGV